MTCARTPSNALVPFGHLTLMLAGAGVLLCLLLAFTSNDPFLLYPFRESQTAISADYLLREPAGGMLAYQLPVLGAPWRVPLEFPLFQQMTAWVAACGVSVAQAGRLVNLSGFLGCLVVAASLWRDCGLPAQWRSIALALFSASPLYALYATAHLIESWALLLALLSLWSAIRFAQGGRWPWLIGTVFGGCLSAMIKITTWFPAGVLVMVLVAARLHKAITRERLAGQPARELGLLVAVGAACLAGVFWTLWAAQVRWANPLGSAVGEGQWFFGKLADRLSAKNWALIFGKHLLLLFGPLGLFIPLMLVFAWWKGWRAGNELSRGIVLGVLGYLVHTVVFFNLNLRHDYYVFGSGVFLLFATVCAMIVMAESVALRWTHWVAPMLASSMVAGGLAYATVKRGYHDFVVEQSIRVLREVKEPGALITFGFDWSPRVPFSVGRKALMLEAVPASLLSELLNKNQKVSFAAVVVLGNEFDTIAREAARRVGLDSDHPVPFWSNGYLFVKRGTAGPLAAVARTPEEPVMNEMRRRVPQKRTLSDGLVYIRLPFSSGEGDWFEVIAKRDADAFFYRTRGNSLVRVRGYFSDP